MEESLVKAAVPPSLVEDSQPVACLLHHLEGSGRARRAVALAFPRRRPRTLTGEAAAQGVALPACVYHYIFRGAFRRYNRRQRLLQA